jgi:tetratricopeptide (TPR) repeat protein
MDAIPAQFRESQGEGISRAKPLASWLSEQFGQPLVRKATDQMLRANSADARYQLMPYLTKVATIPASSSRVQLLERMERALDEPEAYVDPVVALARGAAKAQSENGPNPRQLDPVQLGQTLSRVRAQAIKEAAWMMRVSHLYAFAPLSDGELEQYVRFVESDNVKWLYEIVREGILSSSEKVGSEIATGFAQLSKVATPPLGNPAVCKTPEEFYEQGVRLIDDGKPIEATRFLDTAIQLRPDFAIAYYKRGNAYRDADQATKAVDDYTQAIRFDPSMTLAYLNRGIAVRYLGQPQRALLDFTDGIHSNPQVAAVWIERAITYNDLQQYAQAVADYTQAIRITPADGEAWAWRGMSHGHSQEWQRSWQDCEVGIRLALRPSELGGAYACTGRALAQMKNYVGAISELSRSIELDPASPGPNGSAVTYQNRGWAYEETGRNEDALRDYEKGIQLDPQDAWTHCHRAGVLDKLGRAAEANMDRAYCSANQK